MATITLKNIPEQAYNALKKLAAEHHRSLNSEIIHLIEMATASHKMDIKEYLLQARRLREKTIEHVVSDHEISQAKDEGRP